MLTDMPKAKTLTVRKVVSISAEMAKAIEDFWHTNRLRSEGEAIRVLIERGLKRSPKA